MKAGIILTYFQVDVRVQFFQLVRHAVSLDAGQLGQKSTASDYFTISINTHPSAEPVSMSANQYAADWHLDEEQLS